MSIRRKWLLRGVRWNTVELMDKKKLRTVQEGRLVNASGEIRVRQEGDAYTITGKYDGADANRGPKELSIETSWPGFDTLWSRVDGQYVSKFCYTVGRDGYVMVLNVYRRKHNGLLTLEVEFSDEASARRFRPPRWAVAKREITGDERYEDENLIFSGIPQEK